MEHATDLIRGFTVAALDLLFPPLCPVCGAHAGSLDPAESPASPVERRAPPSGPVVRRQPLCEQCWRSMARLHPPWCAVCGSPFQVFADTPAPEATERCGGCLARPPEYTYARSAALFEGAVREALHALKFGRKVALAGPLGDLAIEQCAATLPVAVDLVVPVPLHRSRERERGFNQAALLARRVAGHLKVSAGDRVLARCRATLAQVDLSGAERLANVRGAFTVSDPAAVIGRRLLLVDDVFTTGATVTECARVLRKSGAASVGILTVARVV